MPLVVHTLTVLFVLALAVCEAAVIVQHVGRTWGITAREGWILAVPTAICVVFCLSNLYGLLVVEREARCWRRGLGHAARALGVLLMFGGLLPAAMSLDAANWAMPTAGLMSAGYVLVLLSVVLLRPGNVGRWPGSGGACNV